MKMNIPRIYLLLGSIAGLSLVTVAPPIAVEPSTEPWQLAQSNTLPPLPVGNQGMPSDPYSLPSVVVPQDVEFQVYPDFTNPSNDRNNGDSKFYLVYIPGQNQQTLEKVRLYEPEAFFAQYKGRTVIQIGIFANRNNAERLARELEFGGVRSVIDTLKPPNSNLSSTVATPAFTTPPVSSAYNLPPVNNSIASPPIGSSFNAPAAPPPPGGVNLPSGYFVVIPGNRQELPRLIQEAIDAGIPANDIFTREEPFGPHVAIGPFPDRTTAEQESGYLQKFGLDARIHFGN
jgi:hypothetical protein